VIDRDEIPGDMTGSALATGVVPAWLPPSVSGTITPPTGSSTMAAELPRLPPATPSVVRSASDTSSALPLLIGVDGLTPRRDVKSPRRAGRRVAVVGCVLLVAGAVAVSIVARNSSGSTTVGRSAGAHQADAATATTPVVDATSPAAPPTISSISPETLPTTIPTTDSPTQTAVVDLAAEPDAYVALVDRCRTEQRTVFASLQAFNSQTGAIPKNPDALVDIGWLEPHPEGWSSRWAFEGRDGAIYVVPVEGGLCDL
jgi:hypothetical protein